MNGTKWIPGFFPLLKTSPESLMKISNQPTSPQWMFSKSMHNPCQPKKKHIGCTSVKNEGPPPKKKLRLCRELYCPEKKEDCRKELLGCPINRPVCIMEYTSQFCEKWPFLRYLSDPNSKAGETYCIYWVLLINNGSQWMSWRLKTGYLHIY